MLLNSLPLPSKSLLDHQVCIGVVAKRQPSIYHCNSTVLVRLSFFVCPQIHAVHPSYICAKSSGCVAATKRWSARVFKFVLERGIFLEMLCTAEQASLLADHAAPPSPLSSSPSSETSSSSPLALASGSSFFSCTSGVSSISSVSCARCPSSVVASCCPAMASSSSSLPSSLALSSLGLLSSSDSPVVPASVLAWRVGGSVRPPVSFCISCRSSLSLPLAAFWMFLRVAGLALLS
mmetsp:Transcript_69880/g.167737  ORF Transcript_69880/g.167737 Transcript_69880/m.167737 type:complete len:235 (+) Transcript_69880:276-980(+)